MSKSLNKIIFSGEATNDAKVINSNSGKIIVKIGVRNKEKVVFGNVETEDVTLLEFTCFGKCAIEAQNIRKGDILILEGKIQNKESEYDGVKKMYTNFVAINVVNLGISACAMKENFIDEQITNMKNLYSSNSSTHESLESAPF